MDIKKVYTKQDIDDLAAWFKDRELPETLQIDDCTYSPNLKLTVENLIMQSMRFFTNPNLYGAVYLLERIRKKLEENAEKKEE